MEYNLYQIDGEWVKVYPTKFILKHYTKNSIGEDEDMITLEYNNHEFELFGSVKSFESILQKLLFAIGEKEKGISE